jgi:hypothetical protein
LSERLPAYQNTFDVVCVGYDGEKRQIDFFNLKTKENGSFNLRMGDAIRPGDLVRITVVVERRAQSRNQN